MIDETAQFWSAQTLDEFVQEGPQPPLEAVRLVRQVAEYVAALHARGQLHRHLAMNSVGIDKDQKVVVAPPDPACEIRAGMSDEELYPPEFRTVDTVQVPISLQEAGTALQNAGIQIDPKRIDVYQLGALLCRLTTGDSVRQYLRSARTKQSVPSDLRPIIDQALGFDAANAFLDASQLLDAMDHLVQESQTPDAAPDDASPSEDTPSTAKPKAEADTTVKSQEEVDRDSESTPLPFTRLCHYEILGRIGRGGMGDVYKGYESALNRTVAIKVLPHELARVEEFVTRFKTEASAAARLTHPNIVQIHFIGEDQGNHFFAMEYVEGESLAQLLARGKRLAIEPALEIFTQTMAGLAAAHSQGMVHRDIKPGNILLRHDAQRALLADFGLVKSDALAQGMTATGMVMGTADYISPEQGRGHPVDGRSDLYSMGVLLYQLLSGKLPFRADSLTAAIFKHVYEQPEPLTEIAPHVPRDLAAVVNKLMAKIPDHRYQTAEDVLNDLQAIRSGRTPTLAYEEILEASPASPPSSVVRAPSDEEVASEPDIDLPPAAVTSWWVRSRNRLLGKLQEHAPELADQLLSTQQQLGGAIANYQARQDQLRQLIEEAESTEKYVTSQIKANRAAAQQLEQRAAETKNVEAIDAITREQAELELAATEFEEQRREQSEQLEEIRVRLSRVSATLNNLRGQRDAIEARLGIATARKKSELGITVGRRTLIRFAVIGCFAIAGILLVAVTIFSLLPDRGTREMLSRKKSGGHGAPLTRERPAALPANLTGRFYNVFINADDHRIMEFFLNGTQINFENGISPELSLKEGDLIFLRHFCDLQFRSFRLVFLSTDGRLIFPLRIEHLRRVDGDATEITAESIAQSERKPVAGWVDRGVRTIWASFNLPPNDSEWIDGYRKTWNQFATVVTANQFQIVEDAKGDATEHLVLRGKFKETRMVQFGHFGNLLVTVSLDNAIHLWDTDTGKELGRFNIQDQRRIDTLEFAYNVHKLIAIHNDGSATSWSFYPHRWLQEYRVDLKLQASHFILGFENEMIVGFQDDGTMNLHDRRTGELTDTLTGHTSAVRFARVSADGSTLITATSNEMFSWETESWTRIGGAKTATDVTGIAVSAGGLQVAYSGSDKTVRLVDLASASGRELHVFSDFKQPIVSMAFSDIMNAIAVATDDNRVFIWDAETYERLALLDDASGPIKQIAFAPRRRMLAAGTGAGTIDLWYLRDDLPR